MKNAYVTNYNEIDWSKPFERKAVPRPVRQRSDLPVPYLIRDGLDYVFNHADGQRYTSKRAYEKAVKAANCEIVGNDSSLAEAKPKEYQPEGVAQDIKQAIEELGGL